jgi:hypothetical protein
VDYVHIRTRIVPGAVWTGPISVHRRATTGLVHRVARGRAVDVGGRVERGLLHPHCSRRPETYDDHWRDEQVLAWLDGLVGGREERSPPTSRHPCAGACSCCARGRRGCRSARQAIDEALAGDQQRVEDYVERGLRLARAVREASTEPFLTDEDMYDERGLPK